MKPIQLRMARAAVGWSVRELAEKAGITANTVTRIENGAAIALLNVWCMARTGENRGVLLNPLTRVPNLLHFLERSPKTGYTAERRLPWMRVTGRKGPREAMICASRLTLAAPRLVCASSISLR